ncbi:hypothetical protein EME01_29650 [Sinorhizobium meliloti]|nr:hypothetical protein EME01_29650 [Sinorhizobium meliloti]
MVVASVLAVVSAGVVEAASFFSSLQAASAIASAATATPLSRRFGRLVWEADMDRTRVLLEGN